MRPGRNRDVVENNNKQCKRGGNTLNTDTKTMNTDIIINSLCEKISALQEQLAEKNEMIRELEHNIKAINLDYDCDIEQIEGLQDKIVGLEAELADKTERLNAALSGHYDCYVSDLEKEVAELKKKNEALERCNARSMRLYRSCEDDIRHCDDLGVVHDLQHMLGDKSATLYNLEAHISRVRDFAEHACLESVTDYNTLIHLVIDLCDEVEK